MRLFYCFAIFSSIVFADSVVMKNGDKLTGEILTTTEKGVVFKSEPKEQFYGIEAIITDSCGNWFSMTQPREQ